MRVSISADTSHRQSQSGSLLHYSPAGHSPAYGLRIVNERQLQNAKDCTLPLIQLFASKGIRVLVQTFIRANGRAPMSYVCFLFCLIFAIFINSLFFC